jgi:hypothetical protein
MTTMRLAIKVPGRLNRVRGKLNARFMAALYVYDACHQGSKFD